MVSKQLTPKFTVTHYTNFKDHTLEIKPNTYLYTITSPTIEPSLHNKQIILLLDTFHYSSLHQDKLFKFLQQFKQIFSQPSPNVSDPPIPITIITYSSIFSSYDFQDISDINLTPEQLFPSSILSLTNNPSIKIDILDAIAESLNYVKKDKLAWVISFSDYTLTSKSKLSLDFIHDFNVSKPSNIEFIFYNDSSSTKYSILRRFGKLYNNLNQVYSDISSCYGQDLTLNFINGTPSKKPTLHSTLHSDKVLNHLITSEDELLSCISYTNTNLEIVTIYPEILPPLNIQPPDAIVQQYFNHVAQNSIAKIYLNQDEFLPSAWKHPLAREYKMLVHNASTFKVRIINKYYGHNIGLVRKAQCSSNELEHEHFLDMVNYGCFGVVKDLVETDGVYYLGGGEYFGLEGVYDEDGMYECNHSWEDDKMEDVNNNGSKKRKRSKSLNEVKEEIKVNAEMHFRSLHLGK